MDNPNDTAKSKQLLQKYLAGDCTSEEEAQVLRWYYSFNQEDDLPINKKTEQAILHAIKGNVLKSAAVKKHNYSRLFNSPMIRVAAILIVALAVTLIGVKYYSKTNSSVVTYSEVITARGERKVLSLPDGSIVTLNAASKIRIPSNFGAGNRTVELTGEAFFDVVHNAQKPFLVKTSKLTTKDIGTSFDVKAYPDENKIQIVVLTGKVGINQETTAGTRQLAAEIHHNQMLEYDRSNNNNLLRSVNAGHVAAWKNNELYFDAASIPEIAKILGRKYNVNIRVIGAGTNGCLYTVKFSSETVSKALNILTNLSGTSWQVNQNQITINAKNCK